MRKKTVFLLLLIVTISVTGCQKTAPSPQKPLIGITSVYKTNDPDASAVTWCNFSYIKAVAENGGTPVILPTLANDEIIRQYIDTLDALVIVGGADIPPEAYKEQPHPTVVAMPAERFNFESKLIPLWIESGKPTLGVCLGMQFTNVAHGGSLTQDIPSQVGTTVNHRAKSDHHLITIDPQSHLANILSANKAQVYSYHHQAVKDLAPGFKIVARSADNVPEAMERTDGPFGLFVQWHPELMTKDTAHRDAIYTALIDAAKQKQE